MTENINEGVEEQVVEKSAAEELVDVIKSEVATVAETKADKADLEGFVKEEALEGVKQDALTLIKEVVKATKEEIDAEVESKFNALPAIVKTETPMDLIKFDDIEHNGQTFKGQKFDTFRKSFLDNTDVNGGRVEAQQPYYIMEQMNVYGRQLGTMIPAGGAGVVKLPDVHEISWASEAAQPAANRSPGGDIGSKNVTVETWVTENQYSMAALQDVPALDSAITGLMAAQLGRAEQTDAVAVVKAATLASGQAITTGVAQGTNAGFPTAANVISKLSEVMAALPSAYRPGASWAVSRSFYGRIQESNNTTINYDPAMKIQTIMGYPVYIIDQLEGQGASSNGNLIASFGDHSRGIAMVTASDMMIGRYDQTRPGSMTYFGHARFKHSVWDTSALVSLKIGA